MKSLESNTKKNDNIINKNINNNEKNNSYNKIKKNEVI